VIGWDSSAISCDDGDYVLMLVQSMIVIFFSFIVLYDINLIPDCNVRTSLIFQRHLLSNSVNHNYEISLKQITE